MKRIDSKIYNKEYYLNTCFGSDEFRKYKGRKVHKRVTEFLNLVQIRPEMCILDIGCGRGDLAIECARRGAMVVGIDYSKDGISIANDNLKKQKITIQNRVQFIQMDAKNLKFRSNFFDIVTSYDVFEHLYKKELEASMKEISRVLKSKGQLLVHTETNKIYLDFTHKIWSYPIDQFLIGINRYFTKNEYPGLQKDPRNDFHKIQHVNEPTYFYLISLFHNYKFEGKIYSIIPRKPIKSWKDVIYNILVSLFPLSQFFPLNIVFAHDYICVMYNKKIKK